MPGNVVRDGNKVGEVIARGASRNRYFVQVLFPGGVKVEYVNDEIKKLKRS